jgi:hypothetical protein
VCRALRDERAKSNHGENAVHWRGDDRAVGRGKTAALAERISAAEMEVYPELGRGAFEETKDFNGRMLEFLASDR